MFCSQCGLANMDTSKFCTGCGIELIAVHPQYFKEREYNTNSLNGLIPYRNVPSLVSYYCGLFSLIPIPLVNFVLGLTALIAAFKGFKFAKNNPEVKGKGHCWAGAIMGGIGFLLGGFFVVLILFAIFMG